MQAYITRTLYHGEDSLGAQAQKATARGQEAEGGGAAGPDLLPRSASAPRPAGRRRRTRGRTDAGAQERRGGGRRTRTTRRGPDLAHDERPEPVQEEEEAPLVEWVETTGKTVEEAKDAALDQLGVDEQDAEFEVVEEPKTGLFGRTRGEARVRARVRPTQPRPKVERRDRRGKAGARSGRPAARRDGGGGKGRGGPKQAAAEPVPDGAAAPAASGRPGAGRGHGPRTGRTRSQPQGEPRVRPQRPEADRRPRRRRAGEQRHERDRAG